MKYFIAFLWSFLLAATAASAQNNYRLKSGDTITVEVLEDASLNRSVLILPDGSITFPFAGAVQAQGRTLSQVQQDITSGISSNFATRPTVFVTVSSLRAPLPRVARSTAPAAPVTIDIYLTGEVAAPGIKPVKPGTTFLQALAQSGGFSDFAATKRIQLRRTDPHTGQHSVYKINYRALSRGADFERDIILQEGDVILVPERRLFE